MDTERRAADRRLAGGDDVDRAEVLRLRLRAGELPGTRARLAARLGDLAARALFPDAPLVDAGLREQWPDPLARAARVVLDRLDAPWGMDTGALLGALVAVAGDARLAARLFTLDRPIACPRCERPRRSPLNAWSQPAAWPDLGPPVEPLALDSPRWAELGHAYGPASDVPDMLRQLEQRDETAWEQLHAAVHHQGDVYDSTYAAIPHIVRIAVRARGPADLGYVASVVASTRWVVGGPEPEAELLLAYEQALARARARCLADTVTSLDRPRGSPDVEFAGVLCGALDDLDVVMNARSGALQLHCPEGHHDLFLRFEDEALVVTV